MKEKDAVIGPAIKNLESALGLLGNNFEALSKTFIAHTKSNFIEEFLRTQLSKVALNPSYIVTNIARQWQIILINTNRLDYTLQLRAPGVMNQSNIKWMGTSQVISVKGKGCIKVRVLQIPQDVKINRFQSGVSLDVIEEIELQNGQSIDCSGPNKILDIVKVDGTVLIESLSVKDDTIDFFWTFDHHSKSFMAEASNLLSSRLTTMLNVATHMKLNAPSTLHSSIFAVGDPYLKLNTIRKMLLEGDYVAFDYLQDAIESSNDILSDGAQNILEQLTSGKQS
jgi:hypothetical protein